VSYQIQREGTGGKKHSVRSDSQVSSSSLLSAVLCRSSAHWQSDNPLFVAEKNNKTLEEFMEAPTYIM